MITLTKRSKKEAEGRPSPIDHAPKRISIRDKLLVKEVSFSMYDTIYNSCSTFLYVKVQEMEQTIPLTCKVKFENPDALHEFSVIIHPDEGFWKGGKFVFSVVINEDYNMSVCFTEKLGNYELFWKCFIFLIATNSKMPDKVMAPQH